MDTNTETTMRANAQGLKEALDRLYSTFDGPPRAYMELDDELVRIEEAVRPVHRFVYQVYALAVEYGPGEVPNMDLEAYLCNEMGAVGVTEMSARKHRGNQLMIEKIYMAVDAANEQAIIRERQEAKAHRKDRDRRAAAQDKRMRKQQKRLDHAT